MGVEGGEGYLQSTIMRIACSEKKKKKKNKKKKKKKKKKKNERKETQTKKIDTASAAKKILRPYANVVITNRQTHRQTDRQTDSIIKTDKKTDMQTHRCRMVEQTAICLWIDAPINAKAIRYEPYYQTASFHSLSLRSEI